MKIKVCGMRDSGNIQEIVQQLSPDYLGFIFYAKSKRFVTDFPTADIPKSIKKVGVVVNESIDTIVDLIQKYDLNAVQLHGDESAEFCEILRQAQDDRKVQIIKAFSVDEYFSFDKTNAYEQYCDLFIFDTKGKGHGGTGLKYDWSLLKKYKGTTPFLLSGGIKPEDSESVLSFLQKQESNQCIGVDLNSGFEDAPALKNIDKLKTFKRKLNV